MVAGLDGLLFEELLELAVEHGGAAAGGIGVGDAHAHGVGSCARFYARMPRPAVRRAVAGRASISGPRGVEHATAQPDPDDEHEHAEPDARGEGRRVPRRVDEEPERTRTQTAGAATSSEPNIVIDCTSAVIVPGRLRLLERAVAGLHRRVREPRRGDRADAEPAEEQRGAHAERATAAGASRSSTNTVTALPRPITSTPAMSTGHESARRGRRRRGRPRRRAARSRCCRTRCRCAAIQPRNRHMSGTGMRASVRQRDARERRAARITSSGTIGTMMMRHPVARVAEPVGEAARGDRTRRRVCGIRSNQPSPR